MGACGPRSVPSGSWEAVWSPPNVFVSGFEKLDRDIALHLAEVKAYKSGMVALRYEVRGHRGPPYRSAT